MKHERDDHQDAYEAPTLKVVGRVAELTFGFSLVNKQGTKNDQGTLVTNKS